MEEGVGEGEKDRAVTEIFSQERELTGEAIMAPSHQYVHEPGLCCAFYIRYLFYLNPHSYPTRRQIL